MEGFNPITDLQQNTDQFNVPVGTSTPEIEEIRERLVDTRNKTAELVKVLKKKNTLFKQDTDKIKNLNRRLYKTIPRIPAMRGVAATQFGPDLKEEDKKARLRLDFFRRFRTRSPVPTKKPLPILEGIIFLVLSLIGIRGIKNIKGAENIDDLLKGSGIKIDTTKINQKKLLEILEEALKKKKIIKDTRQPVKFRSKIKQESFLTPKRFSVKKKFKNVETEKSKQLKLKKEQDRIVEEQYSLTRESKLDAFIEKFNLPDPFRLRKDVTAFSRSALEDLEIMKAKKVISQREFNIAAQALKSKSRVTNKQIDAYQKIIQRTVKEGGTISRGELNKLLKEIDLFKRLSEPFADVGSGQGRTLEQTKSFIQEVFEDRNLRFEGFEDRLRFLDVDKFKKSSLNVKPMSNDIASLNIDTGITNTVIILTDPPTA